MSRRSTATAPDVAEFRDRVSRFAGVLRAAGVQPGDRVAILSLNGDAISNTSTRAPWAGALVVRSTPGSRRRSWSRSSTTAGAVGAGRRRDVRGDAAGADAAPHHGARGVGVRRRRAPAGATSLDAAIDAAAPIDAAEPSRRRSLRHLSTPAAPPRRPRASCCRTATIVANAMNMLAAVPFEPGHRLHARRADVPSRRLLGDVRSDDGRRHALVRAGASIR